MVEKQSSVTERSSLIISNGGSNNDVVVAKDSSTREQSWLAEFLLLMKLAAETTVVNIGGTLPNFLVASFVGRKFSVVHFDGFSLASMTSNLCTLSLLRGLYSAADTLSPQAYGAGQKLEVGYIAMRGMIGSFLVLVPTMLLLNLFMSRILVAAGQDAAAAYKAWRWYQVYSICLPFHALFGFVWKFLAAQDVMYPLVICSIISIGFVLPIGLQYSTTYCGTAYAVVVYEVFQTMSLLALLWLRRPHDPSTWPGLSQVWKHSLHWKPFASYMVCLLFIHFPAVV
jgi:Na+-driven multidrug efflux pump